MIQRKGPKCAEEQRHSDMPRPSQSQKPLHTPEKEGGCSGEARSPVPAQVLVRVRVAAHFPGHSDVSPATGLARSQLLWESKSDAQSNAEYGPNA